MGMTVAVKNMVCNRCIAAVERIFRNENLHPVRVILGEVTLSEDKIPAATLSGLDSALREAGFERLDDQKRRYIEKAKNLIIQRIHHTGPLTPGENRAQQLLAEIPLEYGYLSSLFSSVEGITIEQFIIRQKIERAKELLFYGELSLAQIADELGYSSSAHLSAQFKKTAGMTPSAFKKQRPVRKPLDEA